MKQQAILIHFDNDDQSAIVEAVENIGVRIVSNDNEYAICSEKGSEDEMKEFVRKVRRLSRGKPRFAITVGGCYNVSTIGSRMG